jgi:5-methylcytosine-specific restriction endonuclease McrA
MSSYKDLQTKIFERDNYTCQYCGKSSREYRALVMAHIRTASLCGDDRESNLITLCRHCYSHISNNEIRAKFETKENADYFGDYITKKSKAIAITPTISEKYLLKMA